MAATLNTKFANSGPAHSLSESARRDEFAAAAKKGAARNEDEPCRARIGSPEHPGIGNASAPADGKAAPHAGRGQTQTHS